MKALGPVIAALALGLGVVRAELVPVTSTKALADAADLIIIGRVERVQQTGAGEITYNGVNYSRQDYLADISSTKRLKENLFRTDSYSLFRRRRRTHGET
jgi:hypothetical protein